MVSAVLDLVLELWSLQEARINRPKNRIKYLMFIVITANGHLYNNTTKIK
jgi:hypothetical protein